MYKDDYTSINSGERWCIRYTSAIFGVYICIHTYIHTYYIYLYIYIYNLQVRCKKSKISDYKIFFWFFCSKEILDAFMVFLKKLKLLFINLSTVLNGHWTLLFEIQNIKNNFCWSPKIFIAAFHETVNRINSSLICSMSFTVSFSFLSLLLVFAFRVGILQKKNPNNFNNHYFKE